MKKKASKSKTTHKKVKASVAAPEKPRRTASPRPPVSGRPPAVVTVPVIPVAVAEVVIPAPAIIARPLEPVSKIGPLLRQVMNRPGARREGLPARGVARLALDAFEEGAQEPEPQMPLSIATPPLQPAPGEKWTSFKQRVADYLGPIMDWLRQNAGIRGVPSYSAVSVACKAISGQIDEAVKHDDVRRVELDPPRVVTLMDDVPADLELPLFLQRNPGLDGSGVRVAVIDSGIDLRHPWLTVADSAETCGESVDIPGAHGTHVAGSIASRDSIYRGIAPGVTLINIKALDSLGRGTAGQITRGIDAALDRGVHILSMSVGFNHLPTWSQNGHGWRCTDGRCELCTAVNNAVLADGVFAVVAAGNEHRRAEVLRQNGNGDTFDSEIACPGSAIQALTVAAMAKQTFRTADFSSRGPASHGGNKPDIAAPGVNITSSVPARRDPAGNIVAHLTRGDLSGKSSGTSMATPIVAGAIALILQRRRNTGADLSPAAVRAELLANGFRHLGVPRTEVGVGRLNLADV